MTDSSDDYSGGDIEEGVNPVKKLKAMHDQADAAAAAGNHKAARAFRSMAKAHVAMHRAQLRQMTAPPVLAKSKKV